MMCMLKYEFCEEYATLFTFSHFDSLKLNYKVIMNAMTRFHGIWNAPIVMKNLEFLFDNNLYGNLDPKIRYRAHDHFHTS